MSTQTVLPRSDHVLVCDGAMGTMIHSKGVPLGQSFDEINVSHPEIVAEIHRAYIEAGAEIIETNTFGANRLKLDVHGLGHRVRDVNIAGARIARECAKGDVLVAGSVGPTGKLMQPFGPLDFDTVVEVYSEQIESLCDGGVDLLIVETMQDLREAKAALIAVRGGSELPIIAQMSFAQEGRSMMGTPPEVATVVLGACDASLVGANCGTGPQDMLSAIRAMSAVTDVGLAAQPNAGLPKYYEGRLMYISTPEYLADFARQFVETGAAMVGGCCGTTPGHIRAISTAVRGMKPRAIPRDGVVRLASRTRLTPIGAGQLAVMSSILPRSSLSGGSSGQMIQHLQDQLERHSSHGAAVLLLDCDSYGVSSRRMVELAQTASQSALCLKASTAPVLEEALKSVDGRCAVLLPHASGTDGNTILGLARRYGAAVIYCIESVKGSAVEKRVRLSCDWLSSAERAGFRRDDVAIHAGEILTSSGNLDCATVETVRALKSALGVPVVTSYTPGMRGSSMTSAQLESLCNEGLDVLIADPSIPEIGQIARAYWKESNNLHS